MTKKPKKSKAKKDIIERYCDLLSGGGKFKGMTDSRRGYQEATALFLISTLIGRRALIHSLPEMKFVKTDGDQKRGEKPMNLWFILIGKSRITRRTTSIFKAHNLIESLSPDILLADVFTPQSLIQILSKRKSGEPVAWVNDEISGFFEMLKHNKGYMLTADTVLSRMYDGHKYRKSTVSRGFEDIEDAHLTALLSSTEYLPTLFDQGRFKQGFLNRFIYVVLEAGKHRSERREATSEEIEEINAIVDWFEALFNFSPSRGHYAIDFTRDAGQRLDKFDGLIDRMIKRGVEARKEGWLGNQPNLAKRLAAIFRISRFTEKKLRTGISTGLIIVEEQDVVRALRYLRRTREWFDRVLVLMGVPGEAKAPTTIDKSMPFVLNSIKVCGLINKAGNYQCTKTQLTTKTRIKSKELDEFLSLAKSDGKIKISVRPRPKGKRGAPITDIELLSEPRKGKKAKEND